MFFIMLWPDKPKDYELLLILISGVRPHLIVYNKKDQAVPFEQGIEMFIALRRLVKRFGCCNMIRGVMEKIRG